MLAGREARRTMNRRINGQMAKALSGAANLRAFKDAVLGLCRPFGPVKSWDFMHNRRKSLVLCFLELEAQERHIALSLEFGGYPFGGCVCLEVAVPRDFRSDQPISSSTEPELPPTSPSSQQRESRPAPATGPIK